MRETRRAYCEAALCFVGVGTTVARLFTMLYGKLRIFGRRGERNLACVLSAELLFWVWVQQSQDFCNAVWKLRIFGIREEGRNTCVLRLCYPARASCKMLFRNVVGGRYEKTLRALSTRRIEMSMVNIIFNVTYFALL